MARLEISLFGRPLVRYNQEMLRGFDALKVQELFCYILLYRTRPHSRDYLAELLWHEQGGTQSKKYLRKVLWQLQSALAPPTQIAEIPLLQVEDDWIQFNMCAPYWLDIDEFEQAFAQVQGVAGEALVQAQVDTMQRAISLYIGDLLESWYCDWSLQERERFRHMYLSMLEKLMRYYEAHEQYEIAIGHGMSLLRHEPAHEPTHCRLMRMYYLAGNRAAALRQYDCCVAALARELDVLPSAQTQGLHSQIRLGRSGALGEDGVHVGLNELCHRLKQVEDTLAAAQHQVKHDIKAIELLIRTHGQAEQSQSS